VLDVLYDTGEHRHRPFAAAARDFSEMSMVDWDVAGPRSVRWCCREISKNGQGTRHRFQQWKLANKLDDTDHGVEVCELIANVVEIAVTRDQLDISNLLCFEALERKRQWVEESYRQKLEEDRLVKFGSGKDPGAITAEAFAGQPRMLGHSVVMPELISHVAKKASEDSEILKQQRKALEARGMLAPGGHRPKK
jgi:hypothetical protein